MPAVRRTPSELPTRKTKASSVILNKFNKKFSPRQYGNGLFEIKLSSWKQFTDVIQVRGLRKNNLLYRGQTVAHWELKPSLFRGIDDVDEEENLSRDQLQQFKMASRGRCSAGMNDFGDTWWALGQHMGLRTPLLDWTTSPYVALFFAFAEIYDFEDTDMRVVYVLDRSEIEAKSQTNRHEYGSNEWSISFIEPFSHENGRIVGQSGLFSMSPPGWSIEEWVNDEFDEQANKLACIKILIPEIDRANCLRHLNRMNINYLSLFPDLEGAAKHCNLSRDIRGY
ncbi:MAG: FRG domain-containing protein [Planctomycetota bacterium]